MLKNLRLLRYSLDDAICAYFYPSCGQSSCGNHGQKLRRVGNGPFIFGGDFYPIISKEYPNACDSSQKADDDFVFDISWPRSEEENNCTAFDVWNLGNLAKEKCFGQKKRDFQEDLCGTVKQRVYRVVY